MKKYQKILGAVAIVGGMALAAVFFWMLYRGFMVSNTEGRAYVDSAVPAIARTWDRQQLLDRAAPELKAKATPELLDQVFGTLANLGPMSTYDGATFQETTNVATTGGEVVTATYRATVHCQKGDAVITIRVLKRDGQWSILNFHVDPVPANGPAKHT
jgi:hypothetical protein